MVMWVPWLSTFLHIITLNTLLQSSGVLSHSQVPQYGRQQDQPGQHDHHGKPLQFSSEIHNAEHILEHLQNVVSTKSKDQMTEEELEFHYFKMHDYDNNNKLDGVEIGKALTHFHDESEDPNKAQDQKVFADAEIANIVDSVIKENDENQDGYIEYFEFKRQQSNQRAAHQQEQQQQEHQQQQQQQHIPNTP